MINRCQLHCRDIYAWKWIYNTKSFQTKVVFENFSISFRPQMCYPVNRLLSVGCISIKLTSHCAMQQCYRGCATITCFDGGNKYLVQSGNGGRVVRNNSSHRGNNGGAVRKTSSEKKTGVRWKDTMAVDCEEKKLVRSGKWWWCENQRNNGGVVRKISTN